MIAGLTAGGAIAVTTLIAAATILVALIVLNRKGR